MRLPPIEAGRIGQAELAELNKIFAENRNREDWRCALIVSTLLNINRAANTKVTQPEDLMPWLREKEEDITHAQTPEEMRGMFMQLQARIQERDAN